MLTLLSQGPRHGYQLKVEFDRATGGAWPLNFGQVYTTLQRLDKAGLVEAVGSENDKNLYSITDAGRADIDQWLATPVTQPLATRDELSIKILVAVATGYTNPGLGHRPTAQRHHCHAPVGDEAAGRPSVR